MNGEFVKFHQLYLFILFTSRKSHIANREYALTLPNLTLVLPPRKGKYIWLFFIPPFLYPA